MMDDEASSLSTSSSSSSSSKSAEEDFAEIVLLLEGKLREAEREAEELRGILSSGECCCQECDKKDEVITEMYDKVGQLQRELDKANREKRPEEDHHSDKKKKKFRRRSRSRASNSSSNDQQQDHLVDLDVVSVIRNMSELSSLLAESGRGVESGGGGGSSNISQFRRPPAPIAVSFFKDGFR